MFSKFIKKLLRIIFIIIGIVILGGIGGVLLGAYTPNLASVPFFSTVGIFKKLTDRVTVINKTEQVVIREDDTVEKIVSQPATAVVNIIALPSDVSDNKLVKESGKALTGVLLTNDGLIATYSEKPATATGSRYVVLLFDGSSHTAEFFGYDTFTNILFLRLSDDVNTPSIALANSDDARIGKKLIAIGNAFVDYQNRLSVGILGNINHTFNLSGKTVSSSEKLEGVFEGDFHAVESFVGGPVVGFNGEMVGLIGTLVIDNAVHTFLIPSNSVRESLDRATGGTLSKRPTLGVYYLSLTKTLALELGQKRDHGALIYSPSGKTGLAILADSKAMKAGLQIADVIIAVNGKEITPDSPLSVLLGRYNSGDTIELLILRNDEEKKVTIVL